MAEEEVYDVMLHTTGAFNASFEDFQQHRPPEEDFSLAQEMWVGHLPMDVDCDTVFEACSAAGLNFRPIRQFGCHYSLCRRVRPGQSDYYDWDSQQILSVVVFLSRLIRPTTVGTQYAARLYFEDGDLKTIVPGPTNGIAAHAWVVAEDGWRDWLSVAELTQLRDLLPLYRRSVPDRVRHARKHIDQAFHSFYLDQRCASLVTGFESLLKVSQFQATRQFASRACRLAEFFGMTLTEEEAKALYEHRSAFVHGKAVRFTELTTELVEQYNRFERLLRGALLRASTEEAISSLFESDKSVIDNFGA